MRFIVFIFGTLATLCYLIVFGIIISKNFVFDGIMEMTYDFEHESPFISLLKPRGRVDQKLYKDNSGDYYQTIHIDPVYFDVEFPRHFSDAHVTLKYKNPYESLLELGISRGELDEGFLLKPIENKLLDKLLAEGDWHVIQDKGRILFQKNKQYNTIDSFLQKLPGESKIATYNFHLPITYKRRNYEPKQGVHIPKSLRGGHSMLTYVGQNENLDFTFNFQDVNRGKNEDEIKIRVYHYDQEIYTRVLEDDGIADDSAFMARPFDYNLKLPTPGEGVYKIKIETTDDIFIRDIKAQQHLLVFENSIYLGDNVGYLNEKFPERYTATQLYSTTEKLSAITSHKEGFQKINFGPRTLDIDEKHIMFTKSYPLSQRKKLLEGLKISENDIKVIGKGLFAFDEKNFFDPSYLNITGDPDLNLDLYNVQYVIANYTPPIQDGAWKKQTLHFDIDRIRDADNEYRFVLSFPYSQKKQTLIDMSEINILVQSEKIGLSDFMKKSFNRIRNFIRN